MGYDIFYPPIEIPPIQIQGSPHLKSYLVDLSGILSMH